MAMVTITADSGTKISQTLSFERSSSPREASFSSYLNGAEQTFVLQLADPHLNSISAIPPDHLHLGRKKSEYGEIDVFSAEKYFNEADEEGTPRILNNSAARYPNNKDDPPEVESVKQKTRPGTPSVRSESSWNSRSSLLYLPKSQQPLKSYNTRRRSFLATLGCNCSCNDEDSVDVDINTGEAKAKEEPRNGYMSHFRRSNSNNKQVDNAKIVLNHQNDVQFPVLKSQTAILDNKLHDQEQEEHPRKKSSEVFGSPIQTRGDKSASLERQVTVLAWDAIAPREAEQEISSDCNGKYNDTESDASSDLFEIESFSTNTNTNPYLTRQESDGMSGCITPTTCYAPSEASIQWSTVTASIADFSVMSDSEELDVIATKTSRSRKFLGEKNAPSGRQMASKRPSILSGCNSYKAVSVAAEAHRTTEMASQRVRTLTQETRFYSDSKLAGFDTKNVRPRFNTHSLSESQVKRAPHLLYMH